MSAKRLGLESTTNFLRRSFAHYGVWPPGKFLHQSGAPVSWPPTPNNLHGFEVGALVVRGISRRRCKTIAVSALLSRKVGSATNGSKEVTCMTECY